MENPLDGSHFLPFATSSVPPVPGRLKSSPADFRVDEVPAYPPSGAGEHVFVHIEKTDLTTPEAVRRMTQALDIDRHSAGWAGLKDRHAVTTQWISLFGTTPEAVEALAIDGIRVLAATRHESKLRTGHLRGNRFRLRLADAPADRLEDVRAVLDALVERGLPNYFGEQRFGRDGDNVGRARTWLIEGGRGPRGRFERKLLVSSLQAAVFNQVLAARMGNGTWCTVVEGDVARKEATGGIFVVTEPEVDEIRATQWELSATGPIVGQKMRAPAATALELETSIVEAAGIDRDTFKRMGRLGQGTRRPLRVRPEAPEAQVVEGGIELAFTLPKGSYATVLVREILKQDASFPIRRYEPDDRVSALESEDDRSTA